MKDEHSRDEVRRILNTTPEEAAANALFREMLNYLGSLTDEEKEQMKLRHEQELDEMCRNTAFMLDQRAVAEMKRTVQFFKAEGAEVDYKPVRRILMTERGRIPILDADIQIIADSPFTFSGDEIGIFLNILDHCGRTFDAKYDADVIEIALSWTIGKYVKLR